MSGEAPAKSFVVAIDGPAASGKGTIARRAAARFNFAHLDTGVLYRAVASIGLQRGATLDDPDAMAVIASELEADDLHRSDLRASHVGAAASIVAAHPPVRATLLDFQRFFAARPAGGRAGAVLDGRDIGTVVCPDADVKLFVTASLEERARRRLSDLTAQGETTTFDEVRADLAKRDERDSTRDVSPMRAPADAHLLDTTDLGIEQAVESAAETIGSIWNARGAPQG